DDVRDRLIAVNDWVNTRVKPKTDSKHWGVLDRWDYAEDGYGDCEDFALMKRRMLMALGFPRETLLMTVVWDKRNEGHGVLSVRTDRGDRVLDNQQKKVMSWSETGYRFVKRQSAVDPNAWVYIDGKKPNPRKISAHGRPEAMSLQVRRETSQVIRTAG